MSHLLPPRFLFRFSAPCRYFAGPWSGRGATLGEEYRLPSFGELDGAPLLADVRAGWSEEGLALDVRVAGKRHTPWCRAVQLDATAFFNSYTDLIISVGRTFSGVSRWRTDNISNARARGAELSAAWRISGGFDLRGQYTFLDTEILAVNGSTIAQTPYAVGDPLLRRPRHAGSVDVAWTGDRANAFAQVQSRGETLDAEPAFGPSGGLYANPGHTIVNVGGAWKAARSIEIFARALNLFDRAYEEVLGYPAPRRTVYVGARFAVGR